MTDRKRHGTKLWRLDDLANNMQGYDWTDDQQVAKNWDRPDQQFRAVPGVWHPSAEERTDA